MGTAAAPLTPESHLWVREVAWRCTLIAREQVPAHRAANHVRAELKVALQHLPPRRLVAFPGVVGIQWLDSRVRLGNLEWSALIILKQAWPGKFAYVETLFQEPAA